MARDRRTLDLLSWTPPVLARAFEGAAVRAATLRAMIAKAVAVALKDCGKSREAVAQEIGDYLGEGEGCPKSMLDAYASQAREDHVISVVRFIGLIAATDDMRLLQLIADQFGWAVIPKKFLPAIEEAMLADRIEELQARKAQARKTWKGGF